MRIGKMVAAWALAVLFAFAPLCETVAGSPAIPVAGDTHREMIPIPLTVSVAPAPANHAAILPPPTLLPHAEDCVAKPFLLLATAMHIKHPQHSRWRAIRRDTLDVETSTIQSLLDHPHHAPPGLAA